MGTRGMSYRRSIAAVAIALCTSAVTSAQVKISEVWGGGGNTASGPNADFVELFNAGSSPVSLNGWSVQVTQGSGFTWSVLPLPNVMLPPKTYFLVRVSNPSATGTALPTPDVAGTASASFLSAGSGKVALRSATTALTGNPSCPFPGDIVDFVGYGTSASNREPCGGMSTNNAPPNSTTPDVWSTNRKSFGCLDSDLNVADFEQAAPSPQNSTSTISSLDEISASIAPTSVLGGEGEAVYVEGWVRSCATPILGATVTADLSVFGLPALTLLDNGVNDDGIAGNGRYGGTFNVPAPQGEGDVSFAVNYTTMSSNGSANVTLTILPFPPASDDCADAENISNSLPYFASISNLTARPDIDVGTCNTDGEVTRFGFWYRYDATVSGLLRFEETGGQDVVYGFFNPFDAFDPCNNLGAALTCATADTSSFAVSAGQTYYILVGNQTATSSSSGPIDTVQLSISFIPPPGNNDCDSAVFISFPHNEFIDATSATGDQSVSCNTSGASETRAGVWYTFTTGPEAGVLVFNETSTAGVLSALFQGGCNSLSETSCQTAENAVHQVNANTTYHFLVGMDTNAQPTVPYAFTLDFFTPPANDACSTAVVIDLTNEYIGNVGGISAGPDVDVQCNSSSAFETQAGVWYTFTTGPEGGRLRVNETGGADTVKALFTGSDCNSLFEIACVDAEDSTFNLDAMTTYYMLLAAFGTTNPTAAYDFSVTFTPAQGACCMGTACEIRTQSECTAMSGSYQGDNASCNGGPQYTDSTSFTLVDGSSTAGGTIGGATSTINVADNGTLSTIEVYVDLIHSFAGDLTIRLTAPDGATSATLIERPGRTGDCNTNGGGTPGFGNANDLNGEYFWSDAASVESHAAIVAGPSPVPNFATTLMGWRANSCTGATVDLNTAFAGVNINGTWTLAIEDRAAGDTGELRGWKMAINGGSNPPCESIVTPCPGDYDNNGSVDLADLIAFNTNWQPQIGLSVTPGTGGDYDGNGAVDLADLIAFNTAWQPNIGVPCP